MNEHERWVKLCGINDKIREIKLDIMDTNPELTWEEVCALAESNSEYRSLVEQDVNIRNQY